MTQEFVWYSPEFDLWIVRTKEAGYLYRDDFGEFHTCWVTSGTGYLESDFYLMGEL